MAVIHILQNGDQNKWVPADDIYEHYAFKQHIKTSITTSRSRVRRIAGHKKEMSRQPRMEITQMVKAGGAASGPTAQKTLHCRLSSTPVSIKAKLPLNQVWSAGLLFQTAENGAQLAEFICDHDNIFGDAPEPNRTEQFKSTGFSAAFIGPPGTGKTTLLTNMLVELTAQGYVTTAVLSSPKTHKLVKALGEFGDKLTDAEAMKDNAFQMVKAVGEYGFKNQWYFVCMNNHCKGSLCEISNTYMNALRIERGETGIVLVCDDAQDTSTWSRYDEFTGQMVEVPYALLDGHPVTGVASAGAKRPRTPGNSATGEQLQLEQGRRDSVGRIHCVHNFDQLGLTHALTNHIYQIVVVTFKLALTDAMLADVLGDPEVTVIQ